MEVTFIIPTFNLKDFQFENFKFILEKINKTKKPIIVIEQTSRVDEDTNVRRESEKYKNVKYVNVATSGTLIKKSKLINEAVKHCNTEYFWVNDIDCYIKFQNVISGLDATEEFIQPYTIAKRLNSVDSEKIKDGESVNITFSKDEAAMLNDNYEYISLFGALCFICKKSAFIRAGMMNEEFEGWGYEDNEFAYRVLSNNKNTFKILKNNAIHLWHPPLYSSLSNSHVKRNQSIFQETCKFSTIEECVANLKKYYVDHLPISKTANVITMLRGNYDYLENIYNFLKNENINSPVSITWVINSKDKAFQDKAIEYGKEFKDFRYIINEKEITLTDHYYDHRHEFVTDIYSSVFETVMADYICILEDDMIPPEGSFKSLLSTIITTPKVGAINSAYRSKDNPDLVCAFLKGESTRRNISKIENKGILEADRVGGGFTIYRYSAFKKCLPIKFTRLNENTVEGWDWYISRRLVENDYTILLDTDIVSQHLDAVK